MRYEITQEAGRTTLVIAANKDGLTMPQFLVETEMVFVIHIIRTATKQDITPVMIQMQEPVKDSAFSGFASCEVRKGTENRITFANEDMSKPFISYNEGMWEFFEPELQKRLSEMDRDDSFAAKVRCALTELLPGGSGSAEDVAAKLGVSRRTLQRRLTEENTSFQKQLNGTRELLAKHYIRNTEMSSDEIAFLLGYMEINSFLRAFNVWTGMSISDYRKQTK